jgi:hypothetical protein
MPSEMVSALVDYLLCGQDAPHKRHIRRRPSPRQAQTQATQVWLPAAPSFLWQLVFLTQTAGVESSAAAAPAAGGGGCSCPWRCARLAPCGVDTTGVKPSI